METIDQQFKDYDFKLALKNIKLLQKLIEINMMLLINHQCKRNELEQALTSIKMLEKLIELNMQDLWHIADQRDWYHDRYEHCKNISAS